MSNVDFSLPLATLLRDGTALAHETIENSPSAGWLLRGELSKEEYIRFLMMLWHVYHTLESALERHAAHHTLQTTYNPTLLARAPSLASDISHLLQVSDWKTHPLHVTLIASPPSAFIAYTSRIQAISDSSDPSPLLAHSYVRYLGDLSGGQTIKLRMRKAYNLDDSGLGLSFYEFKQLGGSKVATQGDMKKIKEWFRAGINSSSDDVTTKAGILAEANKAFDLSGGLFSVLRGPDAGSQILTVDSSTPSSDAPLPKELPVEIEYAQPQAAEKTYSLASVISVVAAVCLAHFLLVVGGFTGENGYRKWVAFEQWFESTWNSASE